MKSVVKTALFMLLLFVLSWDLPAYFRLLTNTIAGQVLQL